MTRFGISGNLMSLGAIDFGLIIDGAVVIVENVVRQLGLNNTARRASNDGRATAHVLSRRANRSARPCSLACCIIAIVYLPILALSGIEGKMFHPMALTVMLALGGSLVLALTLDAGALLVFASRQYHRARQLDHPLRQDHLLASIILRLYDGAGW